MLETVIAAFQGPYGGIVALSFGMGAGSGYGFAMRTTLAEARARIDELRDELTAARAEAAKTRETYIEILKSDRRA